MRPSQIFFLLIFLFSTHALSSADELAELAKNVPVSDIDQEILTLVRQELNPEISKIVSHYSLVKFIDTSEPGPDNYWFILDGYFVLPNGEIAMLDFVYNPYTLARKPIRNYPAEFKRLLLGSKKICNPYDRYWWHDHSVTISRALPGDGGTDIIYIDVQGCSTQ